MSLIELHLTDPDFGFTINDANGNTIKIDIPVDQGGNGKGFRPMQTVLAALGGCSAVDVISILKKQRQELKDLRISIDGEREAGKEPSLWKTVHMSFRLSGNIDPEKAERACQLSIEKYCSVAETLRRGGCEITWDVRC